MLVLQELLCSKNVSMQYMQCPWVHSQVPYTIKHKHATVYQIEALIATGSNIASACRQVNLNCRLFYHWKKVLVGQKDTLATKAKTILPEMLVTGAAEAIDGYACHPKAKHLVKQVADWKDSEKSLWQEQFPSSDRECVVAVCFWELRARHPGDHEDGQEVCWEKIALAFAKKTRRPTARQFGASSTELA